MSKGFLITICVTLFVGISCQDLRVTHGNLAKKGEIPFQALLLLENGKRFCGGVLIKPDYVLTNAHCLDGADKAEVQLGGANTDKMPFREVSETIIVHPNFNRTSGENDIALVKLPIKFKSDDKSIRPVKIIDGKVDIKNLKATASGFDFAEQGKMTGELMKATMNTISDKECEEYYPTLNFNTTFCATGSNPESMVTCKGDFGGPLTTIIDKKLFLVGLIATENEDCSQASPDKFTRVSVYNDWINQETNDSKGAGNAVAPTSFLFVAFVGVTIKLFIS